MDKPELDKTTDVADKPLIYQGTILTESDRQQLNALLDSVLTSK